MKAHSLSSGDTSSPSSVIARAVCTVSDLLDGATTIAAVGAMISFAAIMLVGVFCRYVLNASLSWSDELATILFGWATFLFIASAFRHDAHINLDLIVHRMSEQWQRRASTVASGIGGAFLVVLLISSLDAWSVIQASHTDALRLPTMLHFAAIPVSVAIMVVHWLRSVFAQTPGSRLAVVVIALAVGGAMMVPIGHLAALGGALKAALLGALLLGSMLIGVPVALALGATAAVYIAIFGDLSIATIALQIFHGVNVFVLVAIPLLILSGKLMHAIGIARQLADLAIALIGRVRGGLGTSNVLASFLFGDISGSAVSDTAAIGSLMIPEMKRRGYGAAFCAALQAAAGTLGMTAPLSITVLLYSGATNSSVSRLAAAMVIPSLILLLSFAALVVVHAYRHGYPTEHVDLRSVLPRALRALPGLLALALILGGILGGIFTPAEVGAILLAYIVLLSLIAYRREARARLLYRSCVEAGHITGMTLFMVCSSGLIGFILARDLVSVHIAEVISGIGVNRYLVLTILSIVFLVLGMFLEPPAMIFGFLPTFMPMLAQAHIDVIHWGVLLAVNCGIGCILPPVALNLFVSTKLAGVTYGEATRASIPFIVIMLVNLALLAALPQLVLLLPHLIFNYPID